MFGLAPAVRFFDPPPMIDGELELVEPHPSYVVDVLKACALPGIAPDDQMTRQGLIDFLHSAPRGRQAAVPRLGQVAGYTFWMRLDPGPEQPVPTLRIAGRISLRISRARDTEMYFGHIGYNVYPASRGNHYAERACRLLAPLARMHGFAALWITCNPDNLASRRTCERLGATLIDVVNLPATNVLYQRGERYKCRYRWDLAVD